MADREAFDAYVRDRWDPLLRTAALLTGDAAAAEDLVQESLVRAARHWHRVDPGAVDAYVRRVMYTRSIDAWRWRRHQPDPVDPVRYERAGADDTDDVATRLTLVDALVPADPTPARGAGRPVLRGPHRGRHGPRARLLGEHREVTDPPRPRETARARPRARVDVRP